MFEIYNKRKQFWQWDMGQRLIVNADVCSEVHFCNGTSDCSLVCEVYEEDGIRLVNVPNILLQLPKAIKVYAHICDGGEAYTQLQKIFPVFPRTKPADYSYTEVEIIRYETLEARISKLEKNGVGGSGAPGLVFDTVADMEAYIAESADTLAVGQNLYIRAEDVPDYWWDGTQALPVEGKTDLSGYVTAEQLAKEIEELQRGCGAMVSGVEPAYDDIPKVFITGEIPNSKTDVLAEIEYISKTESFHAYIEIKCQGDSSMVYPKKNFTIKLYSDEARETKLKKEFRGWGLHNKYVLKANYIDHSHARNIVGANLWGQMVYSRNDYDSLPDGLRNSPNNGAIEGFPVKVYNNGMYQGIYTWNIPKDDWLYGVDEDDPNQFVLYGQKNTDGVYGENANNFRKLWDGVSSSDREWEVEVGTNSDTVKTALNNIISLCMDADDDTFKSTLGDYLDVQSALDYYIFCYTICALDSLAQNMILVSYNGTKLYCSAYDLDSTFGLWWNGTKFVSPSFRCPEDYQERYSLLWERIEALYGDELKSRYAELRKSVLSFSNIVTHFERFMDVIGYELYKEDVTIYTEIPGAYTNNITQIRDYIRERLSYVDGEFKVLGTVEPDEPDNPDVPTEIPCTGITLSADTLVFTATGNQMLTATATPNNTTDTIIWTSNNSDVASVSGGIVTAKANGNATITATCGEYSDSCDVSVSGIDEGWDDTETIPTLEWTTGKIYNKNTGELEVVTGERCTNKVSLGDRVYRLSTNGTYPGVFIWDKGGSYVQYIETGLMTFEFTADSEYTYAFKTYNRDTTVGTEATLTVIDNASTAIGRIEIDLATLDWKPDSTGKNIEALLSGITNPITEIHNISNTAIVLFSDTSDIVLSNKNAIIAYWLKKSGGKYYLKTQYFGPDVQAAITYFTQNNSKLIING